MKESKEEVKQSEESHLLSRKTLGKKEAKCLIQRLRLFTHIFTKKINEKVPLVELVRLCHEELTANESRLFKKESEEGGVPQFGGGMSSGAPDLMQSIRSLEQLLKTVAIQLEYDPRGAEGPEELLAKRKRLEGDKLELAEPKLLQSKSSPEYMSLGSQEKSKVLIMRHQIFKELGLLAVQA